MTDAEQPEQPKPKKFPTAFTVLAIVLLAVWGLSFVIPSGKYEIDPKTGGPVPGTYEELPSCDDVPKGTQCVDKSLRARVQQLWVAPPNGLYGIENETGTVAAFNSGDLYGAAQIFLFVLAVGAFITITMSTGAITGISRLALRFRNSPTLLIAILMVVFALGGTTYGMWEETLGFYVLLVALTLAMGFDRMVGAGIILLGAGTGIIASTVNPFATGVASDAAGIPLADGLFLRVVMWLVLVPVAIGYVLWYARRVAADPARSVVGLETGAAMSDVEEVPPLTGRQKSVLVVFLGAFLLMIYGFIPWDDIWSELFGGDFPLPRCATSSTTSTSPRRPCSSSSLPSSSASSPGSARRAPSRPSRPGPPTFSPRPSSSSLPGPSPWS